MSKRCGCCGHSRTTPQRERHFAVLRQSQLSHCFTREHRPNAPTSIERSLCHRCLLPFGSLKQSFSHATTFPTVMHCPSNACGQSLVPLVLNPPSPLPFHALPFLALALPSSLLPPHDNKPATPFGTLCGPMTSLSTRATHSSLPAEAADVHRIGIRT